MPAKLRPGIKVRGTCTAGHVTETTSDPGRVTAEATCGHGGCTLPVKCRRIPRDRPESTAPAGTVRPPAAGDPHDVIEVKGYRRERRDGHRGAADDEHGGDPGGGGAGVGAAGAVGGAGEGTAPAADPVVEQRRGRFTTFAGVRARRSRGGPGGQLDDDELIPGVY